MVEFMELFTCYGVDVLVLAAITMALTQILTIFVLKNAPKKVHTFLPFVIGVALYAAYTAASGAATGAVCKDALLKGVSVGAVATTMHFLLESLVSGEKPADVRELVKTMLAGFVEESDMDAAAEKIAQAKNAEEIEKILAEYAKNATAEELRALSELIAETLNRPDAP